MSDYYKSAIVEMLKNMSDEDLAFFYTLMEKTLLGVS